MILSADLENIDLLTIEQALKAKPFRPNRFFRNNHAQTIFGNLYPRRSALTREFAADEKRLFAVAPNARLQAHCRWQTGERRKAPTIVLVHGLEGSANSIYMLGTAAKAFAAGFNVVRLNLRGCGETEHLTETIYHSGMSADLGFVIDELINRDRIERIFLAGFSLGGNMSLKLAGEYGNDAPAELRAVTAISAPIDLAACAEAIRRRSNFVYNRSFLNSLTERMRRVSKLYPELYDAAGIEQIRSIRDFDQRFTAHYGGFRDADDYYGRSSALQFIKNIRVPTLIIHAEDDPFVPFKAVRHPSISENPFVILLETKHGGHVGFFSNSKTEDRFWAENRIVEFFRLIRREKKTEN